MKGGGCDVQSQALVPSGRELRPYQREAVCAVLSTWGTTPRGERNNPIVVLPTGSGKSTVIAALAVEARKLGLRVLLLAHRRELLDQMAESVMAVDPVGEQVGIVQAERDNPHTAIVAASFQTLVANPKRLQGLGERNVILVDEVHHSAAETYKAVLGSLGVLSGVSTQGTQMFSCGFTATAYRADGGLNDIWDTVAYEKSLKWAIEQGFLVKPMGLTVVLPKLHLESVTVRGGDYAAGELENIMAASTDTTVQAILTHAARRKMIVFAAGVDHAEQLAEQLSTSGIAARAVTGSMTSDAREDVYRGYREGDIQALVTVQVLTEGADFPMCDCVVMARPTRSQTLYSQMVGRALRLWPSKTEALVLDLAGSTRDMSLVTITSLDASASTKRVSPTSEEDPGQEEPAPKRERRQRIGVAEVEHFDLMQMSPANWLSTHKGVRFLDARSVIVLLWPPHPQPDEPTKVGVKYISGVGKNGWVRDCATGVEAVEIAERIADELGEFPNKQQPWRQRASPSDEQIRYAKMLGIDAADNKTRARLSDDIAIAKASAMIDPFI